MNHFCTLFNIHFLSRGLALYESLAQTTSDFHLSIFAFDDQTYHILEELRLPHVSVIPLEAFETPELLAVKSDRTVGEYCWTCTPAVIQHVLAQEGVESCTYLDADLYFFSSPLPLIEEMGGSSILLTEHRYTPEYNSEEAAGKYCVQFMCFKATNEGLEALNWWADKCLEWCYARVEPNRFGDQKYLDDWSTRFKGVHVLEHLGGGVAPWNVQQYRIQNQQGALRLAHQGKTWPVVFYHFHELRFFTGHKVDLGGYKLSRDVLTELYTPYVRHLVKIQQNLPSQHHSLDIHGVKPYQGSFIKTLKRKLKSCDNVFTLKGQEFYG